MYILCRINMLHFRVKAAFKAFNCQGFTLFLLSSLPQTCYNNTEQSVSVGGAINTKNT